MTKEQKNKWWRDWYAKKSIEWKRSRWEGQKEWRQATRPNPGYCESCGEEGKLHIDHNHDTKKFRGWLCPPCNIALSHHMTPEKLRQLANYLERNS